MEAKEKKIQVIELRIGNLLTYYPRMGRGKGEVNKTDIGDLKWCVIDNDSFNDYFKPIPLTEEWFLKFGFEFWCDELGIKCFYKIYGIEYLCFSTNGFWQIRSGLKTHDACWRMHNYPFLKYVHQLQNLIQSLTNEELTLKD